MVIETEQDVTPAVLAAMANTPDARLREVMASLVRHLHAFAREVKLTEPEWERGIEFLIGLGKLTNDSHNEAILASDAIGFSTLVCLLNNGTVGDSETAAALLGPFWRLNAPKTESGASIVRSPTPGPALFADCRLRDNSGQPIAGAYVDVWHASPVGMYENQDAGQADMNLRGNFITDAEGRFSFRSVKPAGYPVPVSGPVGALLAAQRRHPYRPAHLHFLFHKPGYKTLITQVFVQGDPHLESDVVFGVTKPLIGDYRLRRDTPPASDVSGEWYSLEHEFIMEPGEAVLPNPPIK
ncbi:dioxygenase [Ferrovibrio sp.]|uniref:dioxygenase family protein n=1 Tax=Ferrovibrio sp. TaxID=1917215 RepID=UPI003D29D76E